MPVHIPTCPEAGHASVCSDCFETLTTLEIVGHAITAYRDSMLIGSADEDGVQQVHMTPTEHKMVEASIRAWVPYMKKETDERPYALEALSL